MKVLIGAVLAALALAAPAAAAEKTVTIPSDGPGPPEYDHVDVHQFGPKKAERVLVLMPGHLGRRRRLHADRPRAHREGPEARRLGDRPPQPGARGHGDVRARERRPGVAAGDVRLLPRLDRERRHARRRTSTSSTPTPIRTRASGAWRRRSSDARKVVRAAGKGGRDVILGGHSLGASLAAAYAAWDFDGKPGYKDLAGIVLIDGGLLGSFDAFDLAQAQAQIAELATGNPFSDLLGLGLPEAAGLFAEIGGLYAKLAPNDSAASLQAFPLLPDSFDPGFPVTNAALFGYAFDRDTSPQTLRLLHVNAGGLAASGDPRPWADGGVTPIARLAELFGQEPANAVEWYFPRRLTIDTNGANEMKMNDVAKFLGLRLEHTKQIDIPIYAFQTDLTSGGVLEGAKAPRQAREDDEEAVEAGRRRPRAEPPRPAHRRARAERVPEDASSRGVRCRRQ